MRLLPFEAGIDAADPYRYLYLGLISLSASADMPLLHHRYGNSQSLSGWLCYGSISACLPLIAYTSPYIAGLMVAEVIATVWEGASQLTVVPSASATYRAGR